MSKMLSEIIKSERWGILAFMTDSMNDDEFNLLTKGWSESAREAAVEARRSRKGGEPTANFKVVFKPSGFDKAGYKALSSTSRSSVLKEAVKHYAEKYVKKADILAKADAAWREKNSLVGKFEAMSSNLVKRAEGLKGKEERKTLSMAIAYQSRASKIEI